MKTIKIMITRRELVGESMKSTFLSLVRVLTDCGFIVFDGWQDDLFDGKDYTTARFVSNLHDAELYQAESFLRGIAYAVTQLVK